MSLSAALGLILPLTGVQVAEGLPLPEVQKAEVQSVTLSPAQMFELARQAERAMDYDLAQSAYSALAKNSDLQVRAEARFRHAMMLADSLQEYAAAAVLLREILDEQPDVARVRIELARMQLLLGNLRSAEKEFRAAQSSGLPPEVEQLVRFYTRSLANLKGFGLDLEFALAPDSNINRATNSDTLGTIIGDFTLNDDAQANSGVGLAVGGQAFAKTQVSKDAELVVRASATANFFRESRFDDYSVFVQAGPLFRSGSDRLTLAAVSGWRWFGRIPFTFTYGANAELVHPLDARAQLRVNGAITHRIDRLNSLRSADTFALSASIDRSISSRFGLGARIRAQRDAAEDPGFSNWIGGANLLAFREFGSTTMVLDLGYSRLEADERLFLFPDRRTDNRYSASLAGTFRALKIGKLAPFARFNYERNQSTVEINDFSRFAAEFGFTAAF